MNYRNAFLYVSGIVMILMFVTYTIYTNRLSLQHGIVAMQQNHRTKLNLKDIRLPGIIRNATNPETDKTLPKCTLSFSCAKGSNPPFEPNLKESSFESLNLLFPEVKVGGSWQPDDCNPGQKVAIIIPYRDREAHLKLFLANIIPFLKQQRRAFTTFVIEQAGDVLFNRASLMNIGFVEVMKLGGYSCFIFHDVDMIPIRLCNIYECLEKEAIHLGVSRNKDPPKIVYRDYLGGVLALSQQIVKQINGFSNIMFGWGGEDDEIFMRLKKENIKTSHRTPAVGNYMMPKHKRDDSNPSSSRSFTESYENAGLRKVDGLSSVQYRELDVSQEPLFTRITVEISGPKQKRDSTVYYQQKVQEYKKKLRKYR